MLAYFLHSAEVPIQEKDWPRAQEEAPDRQLTAEALVDKAEQSPRTLDPDYFANGRQVEMRWLTSVIEKAEFEHFPVCDFPLAFLLGSALIQYTGNMNK